MNKFVELMEVRNDGGRYDADKQKICDRYTLKKVCLNISHIARIEENEELKQKIKRQNIIPGLDPAIASFSTISLGTQPSYDRILVVGKPSIILAKLKEVNSAR
jgi:alpha-N-acetylglucosamine transferase